MSESPTTSAQGAGTQGLASQDSVGSFRVKRGWMGLRVAEVRTETWDTKTFLFVDDQTGHREFDYRAGQYLTFRYDTMGPKPLVRSYTMSSAPVDGDFVAVTVKRVEGGVVSNWMCDTLKVGDVLRARGPIGKFVYEPEKDEERLVFVAAGSGVTPFVSIMKDLSSPPAAGAPGIPAGVRPRELVLLVAFRTPEDIICADDLSALAARPGVRVQLTFSRSPEDVVADPRLLEHWPTPWRGRITNAQLATLCGDDFSRTTYFTCGPEDLMQGVATFLREQSVAEKNIKLESFAS